MALDTKRMDSFDLPALEAELQSRRDQIHKIKESMKWAIKEHEDQMDQLRLAIAWKQQNGRHK